MFMDVRLSEESISILKVLDESLSQYREFTMYMGVRLIDEFISILRKVLDGSL